MTDDLTFLNVLNIHPAPRSTKQYERLWCLVLQMTQTLT
jgi:hypothetical protein